MPSVVWLIYFARPVMMYALNRKKKCSGFLLIWLGLWTSVHLIGVTDSISIWLICKLNKLPYYGCYRSRLQIQVSPTSDGFLLNCNTSEAQTSCLIRTCVRISTRVCEILNAIITLHQTHKNTETTRRATRHTFNRSFYSKVFKETNRNKA